MKRLMSQKGKMSFSTILIMIVVFYGGFVAFKIIASRVTKSQIKNEIIDKFGYIRGPDFSEESGEKAIRDILIEHDLYTEPQDEENQYENESGDEEKNGKSLDIFKGTQITVELRQKGSRVYFFVEYMDIVDLILFKTKPRYTIEDELFNYN